MAIAETIKSQAQLGSLFAFYSYINNERANSLQSTSQAAYTPQTSTSSPDQPSDRTVSTIDSQGENRQFNFSLNFINDTSNYLGVTGNALKRIQSIINQAKSMSDAVVAKGGSLADRNSIAMSMRELLKQIDPSIDLSTYKGVSFLKDNTYYGKVLQSGLINNDTLQQIKNAGVSSTDAFGLLQQIEADNITFDDNSGHIKSITLTDPQSGNSKLATGTYQIRFTYQTTDATLTRIDLTEGDKIIASKSNVNLSVNSGSNTDIDFGHGFSLSIAKFQGAEHTPNSLTSNSQLNVERKGDLQLVIGYGKYLNTQNVNDFYDFGQRLQDINSSIGGHSSLIDQMLTQVQGKQSDFLNSQNFLDSTFQKITSDQQAQQQLTNTTASLSHNTNEALMTQQAIMPQLIMNLFY
jgi:uncharacterized protein YxeA